MSIKVEIRVPENETPQERLERQRKEREYYNKVRAPRGDNEKRNHPGPMMRVIKKAKKSPFANMMNMGNLKRDAGFPKVDLSCVLPSFREWLDAKES